MSSQTQIPSTPFGKHSVRIEEQPRGMRAAIYSALGLLLEVSIEWLVRLTRPSAYADGSFGLDSSGSGFGRSGFYRIVESGPDHWRVRNFRSLHELFHVYVNEEIFFEWTTGF